MDTSAIVTSPQLSPVYLSETARRIVEEVAWQGRRLGTTERRLVPREKRRHHTVSGPSISTQHYVYTQVNLMLVCTDVKPMKERKGCPCHK